MGQSATIAPVTVLLGVALGTLAGLYIIRDLVFPNHFVGDMYGLEATARAVPLAAAVLVFFAGSASCVRAVVQARRPGVMAAAAMAVATLALLALAADAARSRREWEARAKYPEMGVAELLDLARHRDGQFAVYALGSKGREAVAGLRDLLLDEASPGTVRQVAAQALGNIAYGGAPEAVTALEEAMARAHNPQVRQAAAHALESAGGTRP